MDRLQVWLGCLSTIFQLPDEQAYCADAATSHKCGGIRRPSCFMAEKVSCCLLATRPAAVKAVERTLSSARMTASCCSAAACARAASWPACARMAAPLQSQGQGEDENVPTSMLLRCVS